jgi:hypothetical protein
VTVKLAAIAMVGAAAIASAAQTGPADPVGIYALLDHVVVEPGDAAPQRIQVWGAFALADPTGGYAPVAKGYMYYSCPAGREQACRAEWEDLKWIAGTGKAIGYAQRGKSFGRLRADGNPVRSADPYPLDGGLVKVESKDPNFTDLVARLKRAIGGQRPAPARLLTFVASTTHIPRPKVAAMTTFSRG